LKRRSIVLTTSSWRLRFGAASSRCRRIIFFCAASSFLRRTRFLTAATAGMRNASIAA